MNTAPATAAPTIHLRHPLVIFGILLYFINAFTDEKYNIPVAEFALIGLIFWQMVMRPSLLAVQGGITAAVLALALVAWVTFIDHYHGGDSGQMLRVMLRTGMFYAIILGYLLLPAKANVLRLMTGFMVGYILNFFVQAPITLVGSSAWLLKAILPTPAVVLFMLMERKILSRTLVRLLIAFLIFSLITMPLIASRGAFLSLFVGLGFYALARPAVIRRNVIILLALYLPFLTVTVVGIFYKPGNPYILTDWLASINYATISNVERTLMAYMNITALKESPLTGIGVGNDIPMMAPYYLSITKQTKTAAESPHNYYMELAVPYGLPALGLALIIWFLLYRGLFTAAAAQGLRRGVAAFACGTVAWIMLYQPVSSSTRMDVFTLMMFGLYGIRRITAFSPEQDQGSVSPPELPTEPLA